MIYCSSNTPAGCGKWNPSIVSASVVDAQGRILAHSEPEQIGKKISPTDPVAAAPDVLVLSAPINLGSQGTATASVGFSETMLDEDLQAQLQVLQKRVLWIAGSTLALGLFIAFILALSWTRPIRILTQAAAQVGQANYHIDLKQMDARRDELGDFSRNFHSMVEQLKQLDQMKEDFVSAVTHELRSPLGAIESYLNVIEEELREGISLEDWRTYLERLRVNTQRLTRFVNDLLDVAALERGKVALDCQAVPVGLVIQDVLSLFSAKMGERKLSVRTDIPADMPHAWADADKIRQVLTNLLSNAIKFTPQGGIIEVGLKIQKSGDVHGRLCPGLRCGNFPRKINNGSSTNLNRCTPRARRSKAPKEPDSVFPSAKRWWNCMAAKSASQAKPVYAGSCFLFTLPLSGRRINRKYKRKNHGRAGMKTAPILYIEDEEDYQLLVKKILGRAGLEVVTADTGAEGLEMLRRERPGLLIYLDINLPDIDGYTICSPAAPRPHLGGSAYSDAYCPPPQFPEEWLRGFSTGANDYISKPLNPPELVERVVNGLEGCAGHRIPTPKNRRNTGLVQAAASGNRPASNT